MAFTLRKLQGLDERTRLRKLVLLLRQAQDGLHDTPYMKSLLPLLPFETLPIPEHPAERVRYFESTRHRLLDHLGISWADWDAVAPKDREASLRFPFFAYLEAIRSPFNLGSVFRTAEAYGFSGLILSPECPDPMHPRCRRTAMGADGLDWHRGDLDLLLSRGPVFALELGGTPLSDFTFPQNGTVLIGSEELGLSPQALALADSSAGRVSLPLYGSKSSLNLGVAFGILAAKWTEVTREKSLQS